MKVKTKLLQLLGAGEDDGRFSDRLETFIILLIIFNFITIILESYDSLNKRFGLIFQVVEVFSVIIFSLEYFSRILMVRYHARKRGEAAMPSILRHLISPMAIVDLLAILPFYLGFFMDLRSLRVLRMVRLLRILKLDRHLGALGLIGKVFRDKSREIGITIFATIMLLLIASVTMYYLESEVQPEKFPNIPATLWWAVATLTTVGYGDVFPVTGMGRFLSGMIALLGIGLVALPTGILSAAFLEELENRKTQVLEEEPEPSYSSDRWKYCPHCGKPLAVHP